MKVPVKLRGNFDEGFYKMHHLKLTDFSRFYRQIFLHEGIQHVESSSSLNYGTRCKFFYHSARCLFPELPKQNSEKWPDFTLRMFLWFRLSVLDVLSRQHMQRSRRTTIILLCPTLLWKNYKKPVQTKINLLT